MAEHGSIETRLNDFLAGERRRAEDDYPNLHMPVSRPRQSPTSLALVTLAAVVIAAVVVLPSWGGQQAFAPGVAPGSADPVGPDGIPLSIAGHPVVRGADIDSHLADAASFLAGGYLVLRPSACGPASPAPSAGCDEDWRLEDAEGDHSFRVTTVAGGATFVRTSGAASVFLVRPVVDAVGGGLGAEDRRRALLIEAVPWRQPTKGRIPEEAMPPEGGDINMALVPDFVSALGGPTGETIVGYVPKDLLLNPQSTPGGTPENPPQGIPSPVYGEDLTTLVGHMVAGQGFVALGSSPAPSTVIGSPSAAPSTDPVVNCTDITAESCRKAIGLVRDTHAREVAEAIAIVVADVCPPTVLCDRLYPFDSIVVLVPPATASWVQVAFEVVGTDSPERVESWSGALPAHVAALQFVKTTSPTAWGPLAVIPPQVGSDQARNEGRLRITDACVTLELLGEVTLLYWPADRTAWNEESRTITFRNFDGNEVTVEDRDDVVVGGSGDSEEEGGRTGEEWLDSVDWVAPPDPSCPLVARWGVGEVDR